MTEEQAYDHGFYGTLTLEQMPDDEILLAAFEQGKQDERDVRNIEMGYESRMRDLYGH
jgi:hypothetical protein